MYIEGSWTSKPALHDFAIVAKGNWSRASAHRHSFFEEGLGDTWFWTMSSYD